VSKSNSESSCYKWLLVLRLILLLTAAPLVDNLGANLSHFCQIWCDFMHIKVDLLNSGAIWVLLGDLENIKALTVVLFL
jgi:hypothetical protein